MPKELALFAYGFIVLALGLLLKWEFHRAHGRGPLFHRKG
jgi:hypothetical protein